jgi:pimeloyl-ACP methyl ester carboxylesterase
MPKVALKNGTRIHYQQAGQGPDLVLVHGLTGNLAVWHFRIIPLLMDRFRILTYDLRGHGYSDMPRSGYTPTSMATDLVELLDALDIRKPAVCGHSYGGDIALYTALHYSERIRRVVAIDAVLPAMLGFDALESVKGREHWAEILEEHGHEVPPERRDDVDYLIRQSLLLPKKWGPLNGLPRNPKRFLELLDQTTVVQDYEDVGALTVNDFDKIQTPVTLMYVEDSAFMSSHDCLYARLPNVDSIMLPRTQWGHFGPLEQPDLVADHLRSIMDRDSDAAHTNATTHANVSADANGVGRANGVAAESNLVRGI